MRLPQRTGDEAGDPFLWAARRLEYPGLVMPRPASGVGDLQGLWRRSLIRWPDGRSDATTSVHWLQGSAAFADLRRPIASDGIDGSSSLRDLSREDCLRLAMQEGFAGHLRFDGTHFEWIRMIDFQPKGPNADAGSLTWEDGALIERGRDIAYIEHWHREGDAPRMPGIAVVLQETGATTKALLLRVGQTFMFARDREVALSGAEPLTAHVAAASNLAQAQELVNCEISLGDISPSGFRIRASTLPYRVGDHLDQNLAGDVLTVRDRGRDGRFIARRWNITAAEGNFTALRGG